MNTLSEPNDEILRERPKVETPISKLDQLGEGWRYVEVGEIIENTDEAQWPETGKWIPVVGEPCREYHFKIRRRITQPKEGGEKSCPSNAGVELMPTKDESQIPAVQSMDTSNAPITSEPEVGANGPSTLQEMLEGLYQAATYHRKFDSANSAGILDASLKLAERFRVKPELSGAAGSEEKVREWWLVISQSFNPRTFNTKEEAVTYTNTFVDSPTVVRVHDATACDRKCEVMKKELADAKAMMQAAGVGDYKGDYFLGELTITGALRSEVERLKLQLAEMSAILTEEKKRNWVFYSKLMLPARYLKGASHE